MTPAAQRARAKNTALAVFFTLSPSKLNKQYIPTIPVLYSCPLTLQHHTIIISLLLRYYSYRVTLPQFDSIVDVQTTNIHKIDTKMHNNSTISYSPFSRNENHALQISSIINKTQNQSFFLLGSALRLSVWLIYDLCFKLFYIYKILSLAFRTK